MDDKGAGWASLTDLDADEASGRGSMTDPDHEQCSRAENQQTEAQDTSEGGEPQDGGYDWVIVLCAFTTQVLLSGLPLNGGMFVMEFRETFDVGPGEASWIAAITTGVAFAGSPIGGILCNLLGHRSTLLAGCLVASLGMFISAWAGGVLHLRLTYGLLAGLGVALQYSPSVSVVGLYFNRRRSLALGLTVLGGAMGNFLFPPVLRWLIKVYSWHGAFIMASGIYLHGCICAALLFPVGFFNKKRRSIKRSRGNSTWKEITNISLLKSPNFYLQFVNNLMWGMSISPIWLLLPDYARESGMTKDQGALIFSFFSLGNAFGRITVAVILNYFPRLDCLHIHNMSTVLGGVLLAMYPLNETYAMFSVVSVLLGFLYGVLMGSLPTVTSDLYGAHQLTTAFSYLMIADGLGFLLGPPFTGFLYDITRGYEVPFYVNAAIYSASGLVLYLVLITNKCTKTPLTVIDEKEVRLADVIES